MTVQALLIILIVLFGSEVNGIQPKPKGAAVDQAAATQVPDTRLEQLKLELRMVGEDGVTQKSEFRKDDTVRVRMLATNFSSQQVVLVFWASYVHYVPQLKKDGEAVSYCTEMQKRLANTKRASHDSAITVKLPAGEISLAGLGDLSQWYDRLEPGFYELRVKYRLEPQGPEIDSDQVMFEVIH
jgi:hypothetical protein